MKQSALDAKHAAGEKRAKLNVGQRNECFSFYFRLTKKVYLLCMVGEGCLTDF